MDGTRFDALLRSMTVSSTAPSRRDLARTLMGLVFGGAGAGAVAETGAKKKPCPPCRKRSKGKCKKKLPDGSACGGPCKQCQGGSCVALGNETSCGVCQTCQNGACQTSPDNAECGGTCVHCQSGQCVPKPDDTVCGGDRCEVCEDGACVTEPTGTPCSLGHTCVNGECPVCPPVTGGSNKAVGAHCNADTPEECASGVCGCSFSNCPCFCRSDPCADTGESCVGNVNCCVGLCSGTTCVA